MKTFVFFITAYLSLYCMDIQASTDSSLSNQNQIVVSKKIQRDTIISLGKETMKIEEKTTEITIVSSTTLNFLREDYWIQSKLSKHELITLAKEKKLTWHFSSARISSFFFVLYRAVDQDEEAQLVVKGGLVTLSDRKVIGSQTNYCWSIIINILILLGLYGLMIVLWSYFNLRRAAMLIYWIFVLLIVAITLILPISIESKIELNTSGLLLTFLSFYFFMRKMWSKEIKR